MTSQPVPQLTTPGGVAVLWDGPTAAAVRKALDKGGFARSKKEPGKPLPTSGYVVVKHRDVACAEVSTTSMEKASRLARYADTLRRAGFVVEASPHRQESLLLVFLPDPRFAE